MASYEIMLDPVWPNGLARKTRERRRQNLRLVTIEVPLNAYEEAKPGDFSGIIPVLNAWFDQPTATENIDEPRIGSNTPRVRRHRQRRRERMRLVTIEVPETPRLSLQ